MKPHRHSKRYHNHKDTTHFYDKRRTRKSCRQLKLWLPISPYFLIYCQKIRIRLPPRTTVRKTTGWKTENTKENRRKAETQYKRSTIQYLCSLRNRKETIQKVLAGDFTELKSDKLKESTMHSKQNEQKRSCARLWNFRTQKS